MLWHCGDFVFCTKDNWDNWLNIEFTVFRRLAAGLRRALPLFHRWSIVSSILHNFEFRTRFEWRCDFVEFCVVTVDRILTRCFRFSTEIFDLIGVTLCLTFFCYVSVSNKNSRVLSIILISQAALTAHNFDEHTMKFPRLSRARHFTNFRANYSISLFAFCQKKVNKKEENLPPTVKNHPK